MTQIARVPYGRRIPPDAYDPTWIATEFASVQRAIPIDAARSVAVDTTILATDRVILVTGTVSVTLLDPTRVQWALITIKNIGTGVVTIVGTVDGTTNPTLATQYAAKTLFSDGISWLVLGTV